MGAVLNKLALRGNPAPCSLKVEKYILQRAQDAGLLFFKQSIDNGRIKFSCTPLMEDFDLMLRICCLPELLIDDSEVDLLLHHYETFLEGSILAKQFFNKLISILPDKRLALFVVPGRLLKLDFGKMDFIIQLPNLKRKTLLKIAISLDKNHNCSDKRDGWIVKPFGQMKHQYWDNEVRKLADQVSTVLSNDILMVAKLLRELPMEKKMALQELISLPIAEAQLTLVIAGLIDKGENGEIEISNPQNLDLAVVIEAVLEMIDALSSLYGIPSAIKPRLADDSPKPDLEYYSFPTGTALSCAAKVACSKSKCHGPIQIDAIPPRQISLGDSNIIVRKSLKFILNNVFRCQDFFEDQAELIEQMLSLHGSIGLLKPGGGKALAYQFASIVQPGITLVVVPTRFAAMDHKYTLEAIGIHRIKDLYGPYGDWEKKSEDLVALHESAFLILDENTLHDQDSMDRLEDISLNHINFLVLDEAQALSEWNHGFCQGYLNLARRARERCSFRGSNPCLIALTSTNSRSVLLDIMNELDLKDLDCIVQSTTYNLKNLHYNIHKVDTNNRVQVFIAAIRANLREYGWKGKNPTIPCGLIISHHEEDEDMGLAGLSKSLARYLNIPIGICSLKPSKNFLRLGGKREDWERASCNAMLQFKRNELPILICSADTAMQLYKDDIRFTLHAGLPASLEEFYQQSSLAGRDGRPSSCMMFFSEESFRVDSARNEDLLAIEFPERVMEKRILIQATLKLLALASSYNIGDIVDCEIFISSLPDKMFSMKRDSRLKVSSECKQKLMEKALHRLLLIGAIEGYEKEPISFKVKVNLSEAHFIYRNYKNYIRRHETECQCNAYLPKENASTYKKAILQCGCKLIDYDYLRIKIKKDDDNAKMFQAAKAGQASHKDIHNFLNDFIEYSDIFLKSPILASESWWRVLEEIKGLDDLLGLLLYCKKNLRLQPEDPMLRIVAGFCALAFPDLKLKNCDFENGFFSLVNSTTTSYRAVVAEKIISCAESLMPSKRNLILESIWQADPSLEISRLCYEKSSISSEICYSSLFKLVNGLLESFKVEGVGQ